MSATDPARTAEEILKLYTIAAVQQLGRRLGIAIGGLSKPKLAAQVAPRLFDEETIRQALADLAPLEREVLNRLVLAGGMAHTEAIRRQLSAEGKIEPRTTAGYGHARETGSYKTPGSRKYEDILARLGVLGLVFSRSTYGTGNFELVRPGDYLYIPDPVLRQIPPVGLPALQTSTAPPVIAAGDPAAVLHDEYAVVSAARAEPLQLTKAGALTKRALIRVDDGLQVPEGAAKVKGEGDLARLPFLRALAETLGALTEGQLPPQGGRDSALVPGDEAESILGQAWGERLRNLYLAYRATDRWSELSRLGQLPPHGGRGLSVIPKIGMFDPHFQQARRQVVDQVATVPAGHWVSISELQKRFRTYAHDFLFTRNWGYSGYYYSQRDDWEPYPYDGSNSLGLRVQGYEADVNWETVEGAFIRTVVAEALHWLGIVDVGSADGSSPTAFRITEVGDALLHGRLPEAPETDTNVVVQPNFQIFAFPPTGQDVLFTLDRFAKRVRAEQVTEYLLTRDSVYAAQRGGMDASQVLAFLESVSRTGIPQNVRRSLEEWGAQHERIVIRRSTPLIHAADPAVLDVLYNDQSMASLLGLRLAPTVALVPIERVRDAFAHLLERGGPLPSVSEGDDSLSVGAVTVEVDGHIRVRQVVPSVYVLRTLREFTEASGNQGLRMTQASLQQAATHGYDPERIIGELERMQGSELSAETAAVIRRWTKVWGRGTVADVTLVQVETAAILQDLLADPVLTGLLQPVSDSATLALVRPGNAMRVRELLSERGMEVQGHVQ